VGGLPSPIQRTPTRKTVATEKFHFLDVGVTNALVERWTVSSRTPEYGRARVHLVEREIRTSIDYFRDDRQRFSWRSLSRLAGPAGEPLAQFMAPLDRPPGSPPWIAPLDRPPGSVVLTSKFTNLTL